MKVHGDFVNRELRPFQSAERVSKVLHEDNIKVNGEFERREKSKLMMGKKLSQIKRQDNLHQEGEFYENRKKWDSVGERASVLKHTAHHQKMEQNFGSKVTKANWSEIKKNEDNLKIEGHFAGKSSVA